MSDALIFVYNAESGLVNGLVDLAHKTFSPSTYACNLCAITYGPLGMLRPWRTFADGLGRPVRFLHRDELAAAYGVHDVALPALFCDRNGMLEPWLSASQMDAFMSLDALMAGVKALVDSEITTGTSAR